MVQIADYAPTVQNLDTPVPQMVDQLVAVLTHVDSLVPEQVIAVPKISWPSRSSRTVLSEPQKAEQLVEVPPVVVASFRLLQPVADIPALRGPFETRGLRGFLPGHYSLSAEPIVDNPVPRGRGDHGGHQGFLPGQPFVWEWRSSRFSPWTEFNSTDC